MVLVGGTFVLVLSVVLGVYWLFVVRPETRAQATLQERITPKEPAKKRRRLLAVGADDDDQGVPRPVAVFRKVCAPVQKQLNRAGMQIGLGAFVLLCVWAGVLICILTWIATKYALAGLGAGGIAGILPYVYVQFRGGRRSWKFEEQFPEAVDLVSRALRAGHALPTAIGMVASEVPDPVGTEFKRLYDQQNFGMSMDDALRAFANRVPVLDARFFVTAVLTQRESGGNLAGVLDNLASVIRERFKVKRQVKVISAHGRMTAAILSGMPPVLATLITLISPGGMLLLINDPIGIKMIFGAIALQITGMLIMRKIVNVEY
jgi:tight adherence protein B